MTTVKCMCVCAYLELLLGASKLYLLSGRVTTTFLHTKENRIERYCMKLKSVYCWNDADKTTCKVSINLYYINYAKWF